MMHQRIFKLYLNQWMKETKLHDIYRFKQSLWLEKYIDHNIQKRTEAKQTLKKTYTS